MRNVGTDVGKDADDIFLLTNNFTTILKEVKQGRLFLNYY